MRLANKVATITGAGSGMGRAIALRFASEGASVIACDWAQEKLAETVQLARASGGTIEALQGDISRQKDAEAAVQFAITRFGKLDVLCNNAGVMDQNSGVGELEDEIWRRVMSINLDGPMYTSRKAVPHMLEQGGGSIINVASLAGIRGATAGAAYTVSKHGIIGLTRSTAWMYANRGIRCNSIVVGATKTSIHESMDLSRLDAAGSERIGLYLACNPNMLDPEDIANLALFLASDEARHINGANIAADAGWSTA